MRARFLTLLCLIVTALLLAGCREKPAGTLPAEGVVRLVSLSPAITLALVDLELDEYLVGRTPYCAMVDADIPAVGDLLAIDYEALVRVAPTHVLIQPALQGADAGLLELARERGWVVREWPLNGVDDVKRMVDELPGVVLTAEAPARRAAESRARQLLEQLDSALAPGEAGFTGNVLILNGVEPVLAFGRGTYLSDMLDAFGAANAASAEGWAQLAVEDVVRLNPEAVVIVDANDAASTTAHRARGVVASWPIDAARADRIAILAHPEVLTPSTGLIEVAPLLRDLLAAFEAKR